MKMKIILEFDCTDAHIIEDDNLCFKDKSKQKMRIVASTSFTQGKVSSISIGGSISSEGFLSSILLSVVIIVTVVFVVVVLVVVVIAIVGVVIVVVVFGIIVVVGGVSSIFKLSFVIVDSFSCYWSSACPGVLVTKVMAGVQMFMSFWEDIRSQQKDNTGYDKDEDNDANNGDDDERAIIGEEDEEHIRFLGGNSSSGIKKYRGLNSSDGGNIKDIK
ncbi:hypothetical protein Tco_0819197 [Tanacetum coccineum]|uniref:Transmembrane protein n=1 Tax=Tanacetum coccineum TaxID=301880 RepID=A0ABQ5A6T6_9ASTR